MKHYDKNSLIGFVLMAVILIVFNTFFFPEVPQEQAPTTTPTEALISENQITETVIDAPIIPSLTASIVSEELKATYGIFAAAAIGEDEFQIIENDKLKITVANKGGRITSVILKEYKTDSEKIKTLETKYDDDAGDWYVALGWDEKRAIVKMDSVLAKITEIKEI